MSSSPLLGTESAALAIKRVSYTHDAMIDFIVGNPMASQDQIAKHFGYSQPWVSRIFCSDAFQARLAERKGDIVDPVLTASIEEKMKALASQSMDIIARKLDQTSSPDLAMKVFEISSKAFGYGARDKNVAVQNNFVVQLPNKIESAQAWASAHNPNGDDGVILEAEQR